MIVTQKGSTQQAFEWGGGVLKREHVIKCGPVVGGGGGGGGWVGGVPGHASRENLDFNYSKIPGNGYEINKQSV